MERAGTKTRAEVMPVRISKSWRQALSAVARLKLENRYPEWDSIWENYTRNQKRAIRRMQRDLLRKMRHSADFEPLTIAQHTVIEKAAPLCTGALLASVPQLSTDGNDDVGRD